MNYTQAKDLCVVHLVLNLRNKKMINKAIIGETEQVYFIGEKIIDLLGATICDGDILVGVWLG